MGAFEKADASRGRVANSAAGSAADRLRIQPVFGQVETSPILRLSALVIAFWPVSASADVGTPLVWGTTFHLFIGNLIIGLIEAWLLARLFGLSKRRCAWWMIPANYLSAWVGMMLMGYLFTRFASDIYVGLRITWLMVAATYGLTLIIEWPFVAACFRGTPRWFGGSIKGSLLVQSASYLCLFGGYWMLSGTSLYTRMTVVAPDQITPRPGVVMFFISCSDGDVYRSELGGVTEFKIADLNSTNHGSNYLELRESAADTNYWDLVAVSRPRETMTVVPSISSQQRIPAQQAWRTGQYWGWGVAAFQVGEATNSPWSFHWAHWPDIGMWARNGTRVVRVAYATPFGGWAPYRVIHLPGDQALLQLGQQICLVDIPNKKIALLRKGYGVIAFHESQMTPPNERADERPGLSLLTNLTSAAAVLQER